MHIKFATSSHPQHSLLEVPEELVTFVAIQVAIPKEQLFAYSLRQPTISEHQEKIREYLHLGTFINDTEIF